MSIKVLLVDDARDFVDYLKKRLVARNMNILTAYNGRDSLDIIEKEMPDVVVLDVLMPEMGGIETLQKIRKINPDLQVIILTGHGTAQTATEGMGLGASDFLLKPCNLDRLIHSIEVANEKSH